MSTDAHLLWFLVDPVKLSRLPALDLLLAEPQSNLLLGALNAVGAVANVAADIDGKIAANGTRSGFQRFGCTQDGTASLDDVTTFPDHCADRTRGHI